MSTIIIENNVPTRMRDGVTLYSDIYRPDETGPFPVLLTRLPYGKELMLPGMLQLMNVLRAARAGYVVIVQDCRGCFTSEGEFDYCFHEGADGYDTIEWAARLPYSTGAVGMFGVSYLGWTQWSAAGLRPPHLKAIAPMQTWSDFSGVRFRGGAFELGDTLQWQSRMSIEKVSRQMIGAGHSPEEVGAAVRSIVDFLDSLTADGYSGVPLRRIKPLEKVGLADIIRNQVDLAPGDQRPGFCINYADIEVPSLNIASWYDVFQQYTLDNFIGSRTLGQDRARHSRLIVGPWTHGQVVAMPGMMVGEMNFGTAAGGNMLDLQYDLTTVQLRWFDHWMKGIDNGIEKEASVRLFITGENRWIDMPDWPPRDAREKHLYLNPNGTLDLTVPGGDDGSTSFTYDPLDPAPTLGGNIVLALPGVRDQRPLSQRPDVLTFIGSVVEKPLFIAGRIFADLRASSSAPDTDFVVRLIDVHPDSYMQNLCDGIIRARYRQSLKKTAWLETGRVYELKVDLWSVGHVFMPGHRIAVQVTSSSFPRWDRNWNTTDDPGAATGGQSARQTIWHNAGHPSSIILPVLEK